MERSFVIAGQDEHANNYVGAALLDNIICRKESGKSLCIDGNVTIVYDLMENRGLMELAVGRADTHVLLVVTGDKLQEYIDIMTELKRLQKKIKLVIFNGTEEISKLPEMKRLQTMCDPRCIEVAEGRGLSATKKLIEGVVSAGHGRNPSTEEKPPTMRKTSITRIRLHKPVHVAIIGGPGTGKSKLGNLLLQEEAFEADMYNSKSVTSIQKKEKGNLTIHDVPSYDEKKSYKEMKARLAPEGKYVVLIYTLKFGTRMTQEETGRVKLLKEIFGEKLLSDHLCLAITYGDEFEVMQRQGKIKDFNSYIESPEFSGSCDLLKLCQGRYCLVNNVAETDDAEEQNRQNIVEVINTVV